MVKEYRGPFELKGNVLRTSVEALFGASNNGDQLGGITVRDLAYQPEDRGTSQIELPEAIFSVISIRRKLVQESSVYIPSQDWDREYEYRDTIDISGSLHGITEAQLGLPTSMRVAFTHGNLHIINLSPDTLQAEVWPARLEFGAWEGQD